MTEREKQIIRLIKENPLITQEELADKLNCARTSIAVHISNLMKKGIILGKKYIINELPYITTIGGSNIDVQGKSQSNLIKYDSNPGKISLSYGGVGKNIAENISKLGISSRLITSLGDDFYGKGFKEYLMEQNIDISDILFSKEETTSMYLSILNEKNDLEVAISSENICKGITPNYLEGLKRKLFNSKLIVVDTNLEEETLNYLAHLRKKPKLLLDPVSTKKAMKVKDFIGRFHTIKPNKYEAEALSGIKINDDKDLYVAGKFFIDKGVQQVYISLGSKGVFYMSKHEKGIIEAPKFNPINTTGAGDAFCAGIAYGMFNDMSMIETTKFAILAGMLASLSTETVSENISVRNIEKLKEDIQF